MYRTRLQHHRCLNQHSQAGKNQSASPLICIVISHLARHCKPLCGRRPYHTKDIWNHRCKNVFYVFVFLPRFLRFLTFFILWTFYLFKKRSLKIRSRSSSSTFEATETNGHDFIMKVAGCRAALYPLHTYVTHYIHVTLGSAYSDTAAVTSCSRQSQYVKSWIATNWIKFSHCLYSCSYTAPTALGIRQEVRQIRDNVFIQRL